MLSLVRLFGEVLLLSLVIVVLLYVFEFILQRILEKRNLKIGDEIRALLEKLLNSELSDDERAFVASELGRQTMNDSERQVVSRVLRLVLRNKHLPASVRASSAGALVEIGDKEANRILRKMALEKISLDKEEESYVIIAYIMNLKLLRANNTVVTELAKDEHTSERIRDLAGLELQRWT